MAARLSRRARMLVWAVVAVIAAAVLTAPVRTADETVSLVGIPTNWSVFGIVVALALTGIYLTLHRRRPKAVVES